MVEVEMGEILICLCLCDRTLRPTWIQRVKYGAALAQDLWHSKPAAFECLPVIPDKKLQDRADYVCREGAVALHWKEATRLWDGHEHDPSSIQNEIWEVNMRHVSCWVHAKCSHYLVDSFAPMAVVLHRL